MSFTKIKNVYIVGNPIRNQAMFYGRKTEFSRIREWIENQGPKVILLKGGRRSGKTSILLQIMNGRLNDIAEAVLCDFHNIALKLGKDDDLPLEISKRILEVEHFFEFDDFVNKKIDLSYTTRLVELVKMCLKKIAPRKLLILCDEYEAIEEEFRKGKLTSASLSWVEAMKQLPIHFIMTGSKDFGKYLSPTFSPIAQPLDISLLSPKDTADLITKPVAGSLEYDRRTIEKIYRMSGGYPFYVQLICHELVNQINRKRHTNYALPIYLEAVKDFIIKNPTGHIQENWRSLPPYAQSVLASLAHTITDADEYTSQNRILNTAKELNFNISAKKIAAATSWLNKKTQLLDWKSKDEMRYNIDIFRYWVQRYFQTGEDIEEEIREPDQVSKPYLKWYILIFLALLIISSLFYFFKPFTSRDKLKIHYCVRIKSFKAPVGGWMDGKVTPKSIGKITEIDYKSGEMKLDFPNYPNYEARIENWKKVRCPD